ncbi:MAG TPA: ABC transporter substrate-binding protein [Polyangiaceae bacterium]
MKKKPRRAVSCWCVAFVALLVACRGKKDAPEASQSQALGPHHVTLALDWVPEPEFGGFYAGRETGAYKRRGIELEVQGGGAGAPVVQEVATGRVDFGTVGADALIGARAHGADVVAVFATFQKSPQGIMVHASRKLATLEDAFHSGTLALETGLAYASFLKAKFSWSGVKVVPYDGGVAHFLADPNFGQQCYVTSEPIAAKKQGGDPQVFMIADSGFNPYVTVVITRRELIDKNPELVKSFVAASRDGWQSYLAAPQATNELLHRLNPALDPSSLAAAAAAEKELIAGDDAARLGIGAMTRARWAALASELLALKLIDKPAAVDELFWPATG